jgi:septum formation protein
VTNPTAPLRLVLASASPARLRVLTEAGLRPEVIVSGVEEDNVDHLPTPDAVVVLAQRKAQAVADSITTATDTLATTSDTAKASGHAHTGARTLVLGCDSMLDLDGVSLGKPADAAEAWQRWDAMRHATGILYTGHCIIDTATGDTAIESVSTVVRFGDPTTAELEAYLATGEPLAVAGAFTLDGYGAAFLDGIEGDPGNVIGVSVPAVRRLLAAHGVAITDLWTLPTQTHP